VRSTARSAHLLEQRSSAGRLTHPRQRSIAEEFIAVCRAGPPDPDRQPDDPATELGPLAFEEHMKRVLSFAEVARGRATLLTAAVGGRV